MSAPAIQVRNVFKYFGDFPALRGVSFETPPGAILALLGRNGAGKTTLLHLFAGLSHPSSGEVALGGLQGEDLRRQVGFVGHGQWLYDDLTAEENLRFFGSMGTTASSFILKVVVRMLVVRSTRVYGLER